MDYNTRDRGIINSFTGAWGHIYIYIIIIMMFKNITLITGYVTDLKLMLTFSLGKYAFQYKVTDAKECKVVLRYT